MGVTDACISIALTIIGFLGNDPETKSTNSGKNFAQFSVATKTSWKDDKGEWQSNTEWHRVILWNESSPPLRPLSKRALTSRWKARSTAASTKRRRAAPGPGVQGRLY